MPDERLTGACIAVVQARMSSTRLPGKVLADIGGEPLLALLLDRLRRARRIDDIVIATSTEPDDDPLAGFGAARGTRVHRGSLHDVLGRFIDAVESFDGIVVRITADCPLIDPDVVDDVVAALVAEPGAVYASNVEPRTFPDGLDVEAIRAPALRASASHTSDPALREHVTLQMRSDPGRWPRVSVAHEPDLGALRWTVDTAADLEFVRAVVARLGSERSTASLERILQAVRCDPSLAEGGLRG